MTKSLVCIIIAATLSGCSHTNIYKDFSIEQSSERTRNLIDTTLMAYGGLENWKNTKSVSVWFEDSWPTFHWRLLASPWNNKKTNLKMDWHPNTNNSRIQLLSGNKKGVEFGVQQWSTYQVIDSSIVFKPMKQIKFHLPTMEYFFEFPFRIHEADVLAYGGRKKLNDINYDCILMSWKTLEPQRNIDQYIIYINPITDLIDFIEFTVRDQGKFTYATVHFEEFKLINGFKLPHKISAYFQNHPTGKKIGHQLTVNHYEFNRNYSDDYFIPSPNIIESK